MLFNQNRSTLFPVKHLALPSARSDRIKPHLPFPSCTNAHHDGRFSASPGTSGALYWPHIPPFQRQRPDLSCLITRWWFWLLSRLFRLSFHLDPHADLQQFLNQVSVNCTPTCGLSQLQAKTIVGYKKKCSESLLYFHAAKRIISKAWRSTVY